MTMSIRRVIAIHLYGLWLFLHAARFIHSNFFKVGATNSLIIAAGLISLQLQEFKSLGSVASIHSINSIKPCVNLRN